MIPAEAVEAAAKIPYEAIVEASRTVDDDAYALIGWEGITRILEAAAPYMLAQAWEEGYTLGYADCANKQESNRPNPHKEEA